MKRSSASGNSSEKTYTASVPVVGHAASSAGMPISSFNATANGWLGTETACTGHQSGRSSRSQCSRPGSTSR